MTPITASAWRRDRACTHSADLSLSANLGGSDLSGGDIEGRKACSRYLAEDIEGAGARVGSLM
jgi:hypothetical protein